MPEADNQELAGVMYMEFMNEGEVPLNALKLLGASTKRGQDGKIGFFGTGLKYAVALLLREEVDFKVFIGTKEIDISTRKTDFAGTKVDVITINGEKTSMTTEAGIDWLPWFAIREIYSNALDEGGTMLLKDDFNPEAGTTKIYVQMSDKLGDVSRNWQGYFSMKRESLEDISLGGTRSRTYRILAKRPGYNHGMTIFRRGIRVAYSENTDSLFDYDVSEVEINESRVVKYDWEGRQRCAEALAQSTNVDVISLFVRGWVDPKAEHEDRFWYYLFNDGVYMDEEEKFSDTWLEVLKNYRIVPADMTGFYGVTKKTIGLPKHLIDHLYAQFGDDLTIEGLSKQHYIVTGDFPSEFNKVHEVLSTAGFDFEKEMIKIGTFRDNAIRGAWDNEAKRIIIAESSLDWDESKKTALLLEEIMHAESGYSDNTREFQNYIIENLVEKIEEAQT